MTTQDRRGTALTLAVRASGLDATGQDGTPADEPEYRFDPEHTVGMLATALARLHDTEVATSSSEIQLHDPAAIVRRAREGVGSGQVTADDLGPAYRHMALDRLVEILESGAPEVGEIRLTHGWPELRNLRASHGSLVGFVDWRDAGLADPYRDLAVAARSVATDLGPMLVPLLLERYAEQRAAVDSSSRPSAVLLDWYALAAELTPRGAPRP